MKLLVISDLHIGSHARSADLCPHQLTPEELVGRDKNYMDEFSSFVKNSSTLKDGVDAILVTGDISNRAHIEEFKLAGIILRDIAQLFKIQETRVFFVPGNHDVHWPVMKLEPQAYWKKHRYGPLLDGGNFFSTRLNAAMAGKMIEDPYFSVWHDEQICIIGINTASHDNPDEAHHHGLVPQSAIDGLDIYLKKIDKLPEKIKICLMHHHPIIYSDVIAEYADLSTAVNSENLMNMLAESSFDIVVHGHKHNPRLNYRTTNNSHPCLILGAGSFSSLLDPVNFNAIPNLFHVIDVKGRDHATNGIHGNVISWAYASGTWNEKIHNSKLPHVEVFGAAATRHEIHSSLRQILTEKMDAKNFIRWRDITESNQVLDRVNVSAIWQALSSVATEMGYEAIGGNSNPRESWIIVKREAKNDKAKS